MNTPALIPHKDNPFRELILKVQDEMRRVNHTIQGPGVVAEETITLTMTRKYVRGVFARLYMGKERDAISMLSPDACKAFIYIALKLTYNEEKIRLAPEDVGIERRRMRRALLELLGANVITKEQGRPHWFWVNVTIVIVGKL